MHEFIIEIVKSDEIYRKIANASLEKKDDIYRYDFSISEMHIVKIHRIAHLARQLHEPGAGFETCTMLSLIFIKKYL